MARDITSEYSTTTAKYFTKDFSRTTNITLGELLFIIKGNGRMGWNAVTENIRATILRVTRKRTSLTKATGKMRGLMDLELGIKPSTSQMNL